MWHSDVQYYIDKQYLNYDLGNRSSERKSKEEDINKTISELDGPIEENEAKILLYKFLETI